jgi:porphobilinogen synthase
MSLVEDRPAAGEPVADVPPPVTRPRRTRRTEALRAFVRETRIHPRQLVAPLFVFRATASRAVGSMPGWSA